MAVQISDGGGRMSQRGNYDARVESNQHQRQRLLFFCSIRLSSIAALILGPYLDMQTAVRSKSSTGFAEVAYHSFVSVFLVVRVRHFVKDADSTTDISQQRIRAWRSTMTILTARAAYHQPGCGHKHRRRRLIEQEMDGVEEGQSRAASQKAALCTFGTHPS
jgi:hypothetical protein